MTIVELIEAAPSERCEWAPGEVVTRQGAECDSLFVVTAGAVDVWSEQSDRSCCVATLGAGGVFGEVTLLDPGPATATVRASRGARGLRLRHAALERLWREAPERARALQVPIVKTLAGRLRVATNAQDGGGACR